jgi:hypothetical protein
MITILMSYSQTVTKVRFVYVSYVDKRVTQNFRIRLQFPKFFFFAHYCKLFTLITEKSSCQRTDFRESPLIEPTTDGEE